MSGFVCDLHACEEYGAITERPRDPWPRCPGCGLPLYELPQLHRLSREDYARVVSAVKRIGMERGISNERMTQLLGVNLNVLQPSYRHPAPLGRVLSWARILDVPPDDLLSYRPAMQVSE